MRNRKNRFLFITSLVLGILIISLVLGYFLTQSSWFLNYLRKTIISQTNKQINGTIEISSLEGNIFKNLTLQDVVLFDENLDNKSSELIYLKQLGLSYDLSHLLKKKIIIKSISVSDLTVNLHQDEDGSWDLARISQEKETTKTDTTSSSWQIDLESLMLSKAKINLSGTNLPEQFPREISISQLVSQASLGEELNWELSEAYIEVQPQKLTLSVLGLRGNDKLDISLKQLNILSPKSQIKLAGNFINEPLRQADIGFHANPLDFSELQTWFPSFPIQGSQLISGELVIQGDSLSSELTVMRDEQSIALQAELPNLQNPLTSYLDISWKNINSKSWKKDLPDSRLNGNLSAFIQGEAWPEIDAQVKLKLEDSDFNSYQIETFLFEGQGSPAHLNSAFIAESEFGDIDIEADLDNLLGEIGYAISGTLKNLDILKIIPDFPYQAKINSQFNLNGKRRDPKTLEADFQLDLAGSYIGNKPVDKFKFAGRYQQENYHLNELQIDYDGLVFSARGQGSIYGNHEISYNLQLDSLPQMVQEMQPELALKGTVSGTASGTVKDLAASTSIDLQDIKFQSYQLATFSGNLDVILIEQIPQADFSGSLTRIELPSLPLDSIRVMASYTPEKVFLDLNLIQSDTLDLRLTGDIFPLLNQANFTKLELKAFGQNWQNRPDTLSINFNPDKISLHNLELYSDAQIIAADFSLNSQDSYDLKVRCDSLALWPLRYLNPELETIKGNLSLNIAGKGELDNPQLSASWDLDKLSLKEINLDKITGNLDYQNNLAQLDLEINRAGQEAISLQGYLPFQADIAKKEFNLLKDEPLNCDLLITPFDLSNLNEFSDDLKEIKGMVNLSVKIENTMSHPLLNAKLLIEDAAFKLPTLGIDYREINLDLEAHNNKFELKKLSLPSGKKGYLKVTGSTALNLKKTQLDSLQFTIKAKNWQALNNKDMDLKLDSKLKIAGNSTYPTFSGYLNILRARLYLPALLGREKKKVPLTTPLLLAGSSASNISEIDDPKSTKKPSKLIENLRGNLKLSFPTNTWLKSNEMNMELGGELEIIKNSPDFVLSGNVMVVRGNYTVYGRRFTISSGNIYFQGESDLNPEIALVANYILRNSSQEKQTLSIKVTGNLKQPVLQFLLDDEQISEGDGMSYIVFGKSTAELSTKERGQIDSSGNGNLATDILVSQIASKITSALQNKLNLDVIEFKGDSNWRQSQVIVGKYLTNNLFLSYERELSFGSSNEVIPEKITLEYEIIRRLYLQATQGGEKATGVDLIWKFQK